jgi:hypothetical protein
MYDYKPAQEILNLMTASPKYYERDSRNRFQLWQKNPGSPANKVLAFDELAAAIGIALLDENQDPGRNASVPLWVFQELGFGLVQYHHDLVPQRDDPNLEHDRDGPSLEQRLGIRSLKAGGHSQVRKEKTQWEWRYVALEVGYCRGPDPARGDTEKAKKIVAEKLGETSDYVKDAWEVYKDHALHLLEYHHVWDRLN